MGIQAEAGLRPRNQVTLPEQIAERLGAEAGDRLVWEWDEAHPERVQVRVIRRSYYGALEGIYGESAEDVSGYLRGERESWGR